MKNNQNLIEKINSVREVISRGMLEKAFTEISQHFLHSYFKDDFLLLQSSYNRLRKQAINGIIEDKIEELKTRRLTKQLLDLLNEIELDKEIEEEKQSSDLSSNEAEKQITLSQKKVFGELLEKPITILIMGKTGVGKTSTLRKLLGKDVGKVDKFKPATMSVETYSLEMNGIKIKLIDTPGLCDGLKEERRDEKYIKRIQKKIVKKDVDVILYMTELKDSRVRRDEQDGIKIISESLGSNIWKNSIIVFTKADLATNHEYLESLEERSQLIKKEIRRWLPKGSRLNIPTLTSSIHKTNMPDDTNWLGEFFTTIFEKIKSRKHAPYVLAFMSDVGDDKRIELSKSDIKKMKNTVVKSKKSKKKKDPYSEIGEAYGKLIELEMKKRQIAAQSAAMGDIWRWMFGGR
jgi:small GTP-binding protein